MNNNWNWILDGNSIIQELDPTISGMAPTLGGPIGLIKKSLRDISDVDFISKFGLIDRTAEKTPVSPAAPTVGNDFNCLVANEEKEQMGSNLATNSFTHSPLEIDISYISYSLVNSIKNTLGLNTTLDVYNKLGILLQKSTFSIEVGAIYEEAGIYGFNVANATLPQAGSISIDTLSKYKIYLIASLGTYLDEADADKAFIETKEKISDLDSMHIKLGTLDTEEIFWDENLLGYVGTYVGIDDYMHDNVGNSIDVVISLDI